MANDDDGKDGCLGAKQDVLNLGPDIGGGYRPYVRHRADCHMETGIAKTLSGKDEALPSHGRIMNVSHSGGSMYSVESEYDTAGNEVSKSGPAMVSNDAYRSGWDRIFGTKPSVGQA